MTGERILIIDDKIEIITFLSDLLAPLGYALSIATDGQTGLIKALDAPPDLILLDLNMPGMSGMEVLEALRQCSCRSPVILMTLFGSETIAVQAFRLGVLNYITKPFDIDQLLNAIECALEEGRLRRERERLLVKLGETNRKLTRRMQELSTLQAVGRSVASLMSRKELVRRTLDAAIYLAGADAACIFVLDKTSNELHLEAVRHGEEYRSELQTPIQDSHAKDVLRSGQPAWYSRPTKRTGVTGYLGQPAHSILYVPVNLGDEPIGVIGVVCLNESRALSQEVRSRLTALADYAAIALKNTQLFEDSQRQAQQLATVNHIAQMIASSLGLKEIMEAVVRGVKESVHVEAATLVVLDEASGDLVLEVTLENDVKKRDTFRMKVGQGIVGWVVQNGQSRRVNDVSKDPYFYAGIDQATGFHTHSILCVPLIASGRVIGAIQAVNKLGEQNAQAPGHFTDQDEQLLSRAAVFAAIAVENARLHQTMRETIATQTLRDTVVTLSHYVNNPLQALFGIAALLESPPDDQWAATEAAGMIERKVKEIVALISVLQDVASPQSTSYLGSIQMLGIEQELRARLASVVAGTVPLPCS